MSPLGVTTYTKPADIAQDISGFFVVCRTKAHLIQTIGTKRFVMGTPSYLLKKHDTYYFRQAWPNSLKPVIGQREIVRSLGVKEKSLGN